MKYRKRGAPVTLEYLLSNTVRDGDCLKWAGGKAKGYALIKIAGKKVLVTRFIQRLLGQDLKTEQFVLHKCDVPSCINPKHLEIGDHKLNMQQMVDRGRAAWTKQPYS